MNPLERLGKWFDSLWDNGKEPDAFTKSIVDVRKMTTYERIVDACNGTDRIVIVKLVVDMTKLMGHEYIHELHYGFHKVGDKVHWINLKHNYDTDDVHGDKEFTEKVCKTLIEDHVDKHSCTMNIDVKIYGKDIPKTFLKDARTCEKQAKPHTAKRMFRQIYVTNVVDGIIHWINERQSVFVSMPWALDANTWYNKREEQDLYKSFPAYQIMSFEEVDRSLLPHDHWRRWVNITELKDSKEPWVVRYVPRDIAQGVIRYFKVDINFDAIDLGGVSFDVTAMLFAAFRKIRMDCDENLPMKIRHNPHYYPEGTEIRSDLHFNYDNLMVKHKEIDLSLKGYIKCQVKPVFHDNNPFLNPAHGMIDFNGHVFQFDHDFKIRDFHKRDITGDKWPDAK